MHWSMYVARARILNFEYVVSPAYALKFQHFTNYTWKYEYLLLYVEREFLR